MHKTLLVTILSLASAAYADEPVHALYTKPSVLFNSDTWSDSNTALRFGPTQGLYPDISELQPLQDTPLDMADANNRQALPGYIFKTLNLSEWFLLVALAGAFYLWRQLKMHSSAAQKLGDQLALSNALLNGTPHPLCMRDLTGRLLICNNRFLEKYSLDPHTALGSRVTEGLLKNPDQAAAFQADFLHVISQEKPLLQDRKLHIAANADAETIQHWIMPCHNAEGKVTGVVSGCIDISERQRLVNALSQAKQQADRTCLAKTAFLTTISHEIRTPLNAIAGMLEIGVRSAAQGHVEHGNLQVAWDAAQGLLGLLGDVLDLERIESGQLELTPQRTNLRLLVESVVQLFETGARGKNLQILIDIDDCIRGDVLVDPNGFRQVLSNLLSNAIKFTNHGQIRVNLRSKTTTEAQHLKLRLEVSDSGVGISTADQALLFQPYSQATNPEHSASRSSGLGLMISRTLCKLMGGELTLRSVLGQGTSLVVLLPLPRLDALKPEPHKVVGEPLPAPHSLKVLAIDDYPAGLMLLSQQLTLLGHRVTEATDGAAGLRIWQSNYFDVVITDCSLPIMNGYDLTRGIRKLERDRSLPACLVIGFSANAQADELDRCLAAGMDDCLFKPLNINQLSARLALLVQPLHASSESAMLHTNLDEEFSLKSLHYWAGYDQVLIPRLINELIRSTKQDRQRLLSLTADTDRIELGELGELAHRIKGGAGLVNAKRLLRSCDDLEQACVSKQGNELIQLSVDQLDMAMEALGLTLLQLLARDEQGQ